MATKQFEDRLALLCDDCGIEIFVDTNMVMLDNDLWEQISDDVSDSYCDCCIEKRMGRPIEIKDFKPLQGVDFTGYGHVMCNLLWLQKKHPDKLEQIMRNKK